MLNNNDDVREELLEKYLNKEFVIDKTGVKTVEIIGAQFLADEPTIFGKVNEDYVSREIDWYLSQSLFVKDIHKPVPAIWENVADSEGKINSNYGYLIFSKKNGRQFDHVCEELKRNPDSRHANMIYNRPSMHTDYNKGGMSDFICTNNVQYFIRDDKVVVDVNMRSNDAVFGFRNDFSWQKYVQMLVAMSLYETDFANHLGEIHWKASSLHLYESQFYLLDFYKGTGLYDVTKAEVEQYAG